MYPLRYQKAAKITIIDVQSLLKYEADAYDVPTSYFSRSESPVDGEEFWIIPVDIVLRYNSTGLVFSSEIRASNGNSGTRLLGESITLEYNHEVPQHQDSEVKEKFKCHA